MKWLLFIFPALCLAGELSLSSKGLIAPETPTRQFTETTSNLVHSVYAYGAFPKLLKESEDSYFCAFKGGVSHVGSGNAVVMSSSNMTNWATVATLSPASDRTRVQESDLAFHSDGRMQIMARHSGGSGVLNCVAYSSDSGTNWTSWTTNIFTNAYSFYRTEWVGATNYVIAYSPSLSNTVLFASGDGTNYSLHATIKEGTTEGECSLSFHNGSAIGTVRNASFGNGWVVWADAPYTNWNSSALSVPVHGQGSYRASDGTEYVFTRWFVDGSGNSDFTANAVCTLTTNGLEVVGFPPPPANRGSWGDGGYGGILEKNGVLHAMFYSSYGSGTALYLSEFE